MRQELVQEHALAAELNAILGDTAAGALLSGMGRRMYFPKGIIAQGSEAKQYSTLANGTLGVAAKNNTPLILPSLQKQLPGLSAQEIVSYAPTAGIPALREFWAGELRRKNPALEKKEFSLPVVTTGLTAGVSALADLFLDEGDALIAANPSWDNYALIAGARRRSRLRLADMVDEGGFNLSALGEAVTDEARKTGFARIILNFPHNPTGYSPTQGEAAAIISLIRETAEGGAKILVICDDAYFGLRFEAGIEPQSLFAYLADLHENVFAAKIDGPTKEDFAWGLRCGFITYGGKGLSAAHYDALIKKTMGAVRSTVSCSSTVAQSLLQRLYADPDGTLRQEREEFRLLIQKRYQKARAFVDARRDHAVLRPIAFNSGYFMSFRCLNIGAEALRQKLLHTYGVGTIAIDGQTLRVAFSGIDEDRIDEVYTLIYRAAEELAAH
ncbi:MAG: aminotransferase class I/II-fold pyridoxal phosphate-dependent enzyme [Treponema sp.]|nr:aminotransferase class I/II-fold pyridoxal phosphate-dependent enzyme [Treponema sp.]